VNDLLLHNGRATQGRAYLVISSYAPLTAWFFDGYFNVAAERADVDAKEAHVTNLNSNQASRRLRTDEVLKAALVSGAPARRGRTDTPIEADRDVVHRRIREAFLQAFYALAHWGERRPGSFSLLGIDFLIDRSLSVSLLESNCNCELFDDAARYGQERADISVGLVKRTLARGTTGTRTD